MALNVYSCDRESSAVQRPHAQQARGGGAIDITIAEQYLRINRFSLSTNRRFKVKSPPGHLE